MTTRSIASINPGDVDTQIAGRAARRISEYLEGHPDDDLIEAVGEVGAEDALVLPRATAIMFAQILNTNVNTTAADSINSFSRNVLQSYRVNIGGRYQPDREIAVGSTTADTNLNNNCAFSYFMSLEAMGLTNQIYTGPSMNWMIDGTDPDASIDWVFMYSTTIDDAGMTMIGSDPESGQFDIELTYASTPAASQLYVYMLINRAVWIYADGQAAVING